MRLQVSSLDGDLINVTKFGDPGSSSVVGRVRLTATDGNNRVEFWGNSDGGFRVGDLIEVTFERVAK